MSRCSRCRRNHPLPSGLFAAGLILATASFTAFGDDDQRVVVDAYGNIMIDADGNRVDIDPDTIPELDGSAGYPTPDTSPPGDAPVPLFHPYRSYVVEYYPEVVSIGDFDSDSVNEVVVGTALLSQSSVQILKHDGHGGLIVSASYAASSTVHGIAAGDFSGDLRCDTAAAAGNTVLAYRQRPEGLFDDSESQTVGILPNGVRIGDLNGDGLGDILASNAYSPFLSVHLQDPVSHSLQPEIQIPLATAVYAEVDMGDLNSDDLNDIVYMRVTGGSGPQIAVLYQLPTGEFSTPEEYFTGTGVLGLTHAIGVGDLNDDGRDDIAVAMGGNYPNARIGVFFQNTSGSLDPVIAVPSYDNPSALEVADIDLDGKNEVIVAHGGWSRLSVYEQDANDALVLYDRYVVPYGSYEPQSIAVGDINGDDLPDVVLAKNAGSKLAVLLGTGLGGQRPPTAFAGEDQTVECTGFDGATVTLDGGGSSDPDGDLISCRWVSDTCSLDQALDCVTSATCPVGQHAATLVVNDGVRDSTPDQVSITVEDTTAPTLEIALTPSILWPPNHRLIDVESAVLATDRCGTPSVVLGSVTSSEADDGHGDGNTVYDIQGADPGFPDFGFKLRAERVATGVGRLYTAIYLATDASGNQGSAAGFAVVPHDQGGRTDPLEIELEESEEGTRVVWSETPGAVSYDVIRGHLRNVSETDEVILLGPVTCIESDSADQSTAGSEDSMLPGPGETFFYLVEYNDGTSSTYGTESADRPRAPGAGTCQ